MAHLLHVGGIQTSQEIGCEVLNQHTLYQWSDIFLTGRFNNACIFGLYLYSSSLLVH